MRDPNESKPSRLWTVLRRIAAILTSLPGRIAISALLLGVVAASIDWATLGDRLAGGAWGWFAASVAVVFCALLLGAIRWHALLHGAGLSTSLRDSLRAYGVGAFSNNLLPTGFGGDAVRAWLVARSGRPLARAFTSVVVDRASALGCLLLLGLAGLALAPGSIPVDLATLFLAITLACTAGAIVAVAVLRHGGVARMLPALVRPWMDEITLTLRAYERERGLQILALVLGVVFQVLIIAQVWMLGRALHLSIDPPVLAVIVPLVLIATVLPISIAGFGVREGAYVSLLGAVGVSASDAALLSLLTVASMAIASLPGGIALATRGQRPPLPDEQWG